MTSLGQNWFIFCMRLRWLKPLPVQISRLTRILFKLNCDPAITYRPFQLIDFVIEDYFIPSKYMNSAAFNLGFKCFRQLSQVTVRSKHFLALGGRSLADCTCFVGPKHSIGSTRGAFQLLGTLQMSSSTVTTIESELRERYKPRDIKFKNPYGHTACLEWGNPNSPHKVLCMHGWLDNAGSFERLIPFILNHGDNANNYHILAMDQPGVGFSSHLPSGTFYTQYNSIIEMRRITQELKWDKVILISHSLGAHLSFMYSCIYPKQVEAVVSIDLTHPLAVQSQNWNISISNSIEEYFKYEYLHEDDPTTNSNVRVYSEKDAIKRLMDSHSNSLTKESAEVLFKRGTTKQRFGYTFSRDLRLRYMSIENKLTDELMLEYMSGPFSANLLIVHSNKSPYHRPEEIKSKYYELYARNCPLFRDVRLDGTHHLHMNTPEIVAPEINKFLDELRARSHGDGTQLKKSNL